jgi:hypothetical protein
MLLLAKKFIPKWKVHDYDNESVFKMFLRTLVPQFNESIN